MFNLARYNTINGRVNADMNRLRRALETPEGGKGVYSEGASLNPSALTQTYVAARTGRENENRYRVNFSAPKEDVAVSIALDVSASMDSNIRVSGSAQERALAKMLGKPTCMSEVGYSASALMTAFQRAGIKSQLSLVKPGTPPQPQMEREIVGPKNLIVSSFSQPWTEKESKFIVDFSPHTGTSLTDYAWCAIEALRPRKERHRIAIFMTDMADRGSMTHLHDMARQALLDGIVLAGVGMDPSRNMKDYYERVLPNALHCVDAESFAGSIIPFIIKSVRNKQKEIF